MKFVKFMRTICLTTLLMVMWFAPGCNSVEEKNRQADKTADLVLKLLAAEQTDSLYANYTTEGFRQANSEEILRKLAKALSIYLGEPEKHSLMEFRLKSFNGDATGEYLYKVQWAKAEGTLLLKLQWDNGAWKIQTLDIQSPALEAGRKPTTKPVNTGETIQI
jgi:hypothetical protein